jgi:type II secretory pathway pseudopilin PulG
MKFLKTPFVDLKTTRAFSLIESVVAIGIFAFVIVGILGLFPAGVQRQADAAAEARARIIAESIFSAINASDSLTDSKLPPEVAEDASRLKRSDHTRGTLIGFSQDGTAVNYVWPVGSLSDWVSGNTPNGQDITIKARIQAVPVPDNPNLYQVTVDVGSPANLPESARKAFSFTSMVFSPPPA